MPPKSLPAATATPNPNAHPRPHPLTRPGGSRGPALTFFAAMAAAAAAIPAARAQEPYRPQTPGALLAAETLRRQIPDRSFERLVEISGKDGNPIPRAWTVTVPDPRSPSTLTEYVVRGRKVEVRGETNTFYPRVPPEGFFAVPRVKVDSEQAFRIADREAGLARIGFDSLDFRLRAREFSEEAIWTVRLRDKDDEIVGNVDLAASSGKVLRAVWYYRDPSSGTMRIMDSASPATPRPVTPPPPPAPVPEETPLPDAISPETLPPPPLNPLPESRPEPLPVPVPGSIPSPAPLPVPPPDVSPEPQPQPVPVPVPTPSPAPAPSPPPRVEPSPRPYIPSAPPRVESAPRPRPAAPTIPGPR